MPRSRSSCDGGVEVGDLDRDVLAAAVRDVTLDQVDLLAPDVEPCTTEGEVGTIRASSQPEHVGVELDALRRVADVDRHVMNPQRLHRISVSDDYTGISHGASGACGVEQHAALGGRQDPASGRDRVGIDGDRRDAEPHQVLGERRVA